MYSGCYAILGFQGGHPVLIRMIKVQIDKIYIVFRDLVRSIITLWGLSLDYFRLNCTFVCPAWKQLYSEVQNYFTENREFMKCSITTLKMTPTGIVIEHDSVTFHFVVMINQMVCYKYEFLSKIAKRIAADFTARIYYRLMRKGYWFHHAL